VLPQPDTLFLPTVASTSVRGQFIKRFRGGGGQRAADIKSRLKLFCRVNKYRFLTFGRLRQVLKA
jgi:hypothetical protein